MIRYAGGKCKLASWVLSQFPPANTITQYIEPFVGGGWVWYNFVQRNLEGVPPCVLNDYNPVIIRTWRSLSNPVSRADVVEYLETIPNGPEYFAKQDIETPEGWLYCQSTSFGAKGKSAGWAAHKGGRHHLAALVERIDRVQDHLDHITTSMFEGTALVRGLGLDEPGKFLYLDPPYHEKQHYYQRTVDHHALFDALRRYKHGRWLLSHHECELVRAWFPETDFHWERRETISHTDNVNRSQESGAITRTEVLIRNY